MVLMVMEPQLINQHRTSVSHLSTRPLMVHKLVQNLSRYNLVQTTPLNHSHYLLFARVYPLTLKSASYARWLLSTLTMYSSPAPTASTPSTLSVRSYLRLLVAMTGTVWSANKNVAKIYFVSSKRTIERRQKTVYARRLRNNALKMKLVNYVRPN